MDGCIGKRREKGRDADLGYNTSTYNKYTIEANVTKSLIYILLLHCGNLTCIQILKTNS
jgi:hypothetical protein